MELNHDLTFLVDYANRSKTNNGKFQGWGTSLCWWANRIGGSQALARESARLFYSKDGLGFNIMRYNIGGGDDPEHDHITRSDSEVPGWLYKNPDTGMFEYNYTADSRQLRVLKECYRAAGEDAYVEVFSNSPPYFMTESGCSSGAENAGCNNLKPKYYGNFGKYLATVSSHIEKKLNVRVSSVSPMNEPDTDYWHAFSEKQEGCHVDPGADQSEIILETAAAFSAARLSAEIVGSDETSTDKALSSYLAYSDEARKTLDRISTHTYGTDKIKELGALRRKKGFNLWMSEVDSGEVAGDDAGEMGAALWIAKKIISDINALDPSAWVMWQVIGTYVSTQGFNGKKDAGMPDVTKGFWGAAVADLDLQTVYLTQKYYAIGQFTRFIRPGSTVILTDNDSVIAAYDPGKKSLSVVAVNATGKDKSAAFDFKGFKVGGTASVIRTSGSLGNGESWKELGEIHADSSGFKFTLIANSVTTFVIDRVTPGK
ncbi:MAG: hypothetical protein ILP13_02730 [Lachnospiraceae bacterium]|nr:hypothetical protein [Lachnospiraceae bacterium]